MARRKRDLTKALRTDILEISGLPALAQIIQSRGRGRDTILAHITPNEARILKERGGSGTRNPQTGLLEFQEDYFDFTAPTYTPPPTTTTDYIPQVTSEPLPPVAPQQSFTEPYGMGGFEAAPQYQPNVADFYAQPTGAAPAPSTALPVYAQGGAAMPAVADPYYAAGAAPITPKEEEDYLTRLGKRAGKALEDPATLAKIGISGLGGLSGIIQGRRAGRQAKQFEERQRAIAEPYRRQGQEMVAAAQRGELTPAAQQAMQAARAQAAQATERAGGVGIQQQQARLAELQQRLLQQQSDYGIKLTSIGDNIALGAIRSGLQASQAANQAQGAFFQAMGNVLGFGLPQARVG